MTPHPPADGTPPEFVDEASGPAPPQPLGYVKLPIPGTPVVPVTQTRGGPTPYFEAAAAIGVEIDPRLLYRQETCRSCQCVENRKKEIDPEWENCPYCGKSITEVRMVAIPEWDSKDAGRLLLAGFTVVTTASPDLPGMESTHLGRDIIRRGVRLVVGEFVSRTDATRMARMTDAPDVGATRSRLKEALEPLGLWDDKKFGLWAVLNRVC
jgi:hypothetical protein